MPTSSLQRRGRHATRAGQEFGWVVGWTILGTFLPGSGLLAAGRRVAGWYVVVISLAALAAAGGYLASTGISLRTLLTDAVDPQFLLTVAILFGALAVFMLVVILYTHMALRREAVLTVGQRVLSAALVLSLLAAVLAPLGTASRYALIQRDLLTKVFGGKHANKTAPRAKVGKANPWAGVPRLNVLLMGSDAGPDRTGLRPDSMILASINTSTGDTVMFNLPRNLQRAPFPEGSQGAKAWPYGFGPVGSSGRRSCDATKTSDDGQLCELNAIWVTTEQSARSYFPGDDDPGLTATEQAIQGVTGLKVDYYVMLDLSGFKDFVNALGGIRVNIKERLPIGGSVSYPHATEWLEKGDNQLLDGYHALWFARSRWSTSDYSRMKRQRCAIAALAKRADPVKLAQGFAQIAASLEKHLSTDIPLDQLSAWVELALKVKKNKIRSLPITPEVYGGSWANPDFSLILAAVQANLNPPKKAATTPSTSAGTGSTATTTKSTRRHHTTSTTTTPSDPNVAMDVNAVC